MKRDIFIVSLLVVSVLLAASCSKDNEENIATNSITITGVIERHSDDVDTRTGIVEDNANYADGENFYWVDGDKVKLLFYDNGILTSTPETRIYRAKVAEGTISATCNSFVPNSAEDAVPVEDGSYTVFALYPADGWVEFNTAFTVSMPEDNIFTMSSNKSTGIGPYMFKRAKSEEVVIGAGNQNIALAFTPLTSIMRFVINDNLFGDTKYKSFEFISSRSAIFAVSASMSSIDRASFSLSTSTSRITVNIDEEFQDGNNGLINIFVPIIYNSGPFKGGNTFTMVVNGTDDREFIYGPFSVSQHFDFLLDNGFKTGHSYWIKMNTGSNNNITESSIDQTAISAYAPTDVLFSIKGTYAANAVKVRVWDTTADNELVAEVPIANAQNGATGTVILTVPANTTWDSRDLAFQYLHPVTGQWVTISTITQEGYAVTATATKVTKVTGGDCIVTITSYRPELSIRAISEGVTLASGTVIAGTTEVSGTGTLSIPRNNTEESRLITIQWSKDGITWTDINDFTQNYTIADRFAKSNIVWDGTKLTFATTQAENSTVAAANSQGVFFSWGSLVAIVPSDLPSPSDNPSGPQTISASYITGKYPDGHVLFAPTALTDFSWGNVAYLNLKEEGGFGANAEENDFTGYGGSEGNPGPGYNVDKNLGDICRYISDQGWVEGDWRLPTYTELRRLINEARYIISGNLTDITVSPSGNPVSSGYYPNHFGYYTPTSGVRLGLELSTDDSVTNPSGGVYIPTGGARYFNGSAISVGSEGNCWSGSYVNEYNVYHFLIRHDGSWLFSGYKFTALPIRCIRE